MKDYLRDVFGSLFLPNYFGKRDEGGESNDLVVAAPKFFTLTIPEDSSLEEIPLSRRYAPGGVYDAYGRPGKERLTEVNKKYRKAQLKTFKFPGTWNGGKARLYVHVLMEPHLRAALAECAREGVLPYIGRLGGYNYRHIRHNVANPLSLHSFGIAVDIESSKNRAVSRRDKWLDRNKKRLKGPSDRAKYGPVPPPFSKGWMKLYPEGMPYELVRAFLRVGFTWGASWGRDDWLRVVEQHGVGYDEKSHRIAKWSEVRFCDPMHFELVDRKKNG